MSIEKFSVLVTGTKVNTLQKQPELTKDQTKQRANKDINELQAVLCLQPSVKFGLCSSLINNPASVQFVLCSKTDVQQYVTGVT